MTSEAEPAEDATGQGSSAAAPSGVALPDCQHLDEDPEALEDPVHSGDARHQHELHAHEQRPPAPSA